MVARLFNKNLESLPESVLTRFQAFEELRCQYLGESFEYQVRESNFEVQNLVKSLSGLMIPKVALPLSETWVKSLDG